MTHRECAVYSVYGYVIWEHESMLRVALWTLEKATPADTRLNSP